ncbi:MAG: hypothetical protein E6Q97_39310 [Desulfurellales bacterium]|nr:MAG: hypothetical protein E6Q97_39310 [Desulfurellales bacterium]
MRTIKTTTYKGTVIRVGNEKREMLLSMTLLLRMYGFTAIEIPVIQYRETFTGKVGAENNNLMFNFTDRNNRELCLAPEYTSVVQQLAKTDFKDKRDVGLFYVAECFRGERSQRGRWRQFTQLGVEVLNPTAVVGVTEIQTLAMTLISEIAGISDVTLTTDVTRGLDYYRDGKGFEIVSKCGLQLCGGGEYEGGIGFAIGIDRLMLVKESVKAG